MPSLADSLATLAQQSDQITYLSSLNAQPAGPFVQSYLHLPAGPNNKRTTVLSQIRDAADSEVRLFKFVGEVDSTAGGVGGKRVEKREEVVVTPLRELKKRSRGGGGGGSGEEIEVMLKTALRLVDDYRPMPRAKAHVQSLLATHQKQLDRIAELERLIAEATSPQGPPPAPSAAKGSASTNSSASAGDIKLPADEAIKAEEEAIRVLEASVLPLRRKAARSASQSPVKEPSTNTLTLSTPPSSPPGSGAPSTSRPALHAQSHGAYTAEAMQTPRPMPTVTNSLVNGTTPHRGTGLPAAGGTINRFSPLRLLGTPRAPVGPSALGNGNWTGRHGEDTEKRTIFAHRRGLGRSASGSKRLPPQPVFQVEPASATPAHAGAEAGSAGSDEEGEGEDSGSGNVGEDETVRIAPPLPVAATRPESDAQEIFPVEGVPNTAAPLAGSTSTPSTEETSAAEPGKVAGVAIDQDCVKSAVTRIWDTLSEMMRQGVPDGQSVSQDPAQTIQHIYRISQSDPPPPPSPSSASTLSSLSSLATGPTGLPKAPPITGDTILVAHLLMVLLHAPGAVAPLAEVKSTLMSVARARGWDGAEQVATKVLYATVGKRTIAIDRRGAAGGTVSFSK